MRICNITAIWLVGASSILVSGPCFSNVEKENRLVASVSSIQHPNSSISKTVTIFFTVHSPDSLSGTQFSVATDSKERAEVREEFPQGSLQLLEVAEGLTKELLVQKKARNSIDESLDVGIDSMAISQAFFIPTVSMKNLPSNPTRFSAIQNNAEQVVPPKSDRAGG